MRKLLSFIFAINIASALEFGYMGNEAFGMGGAGVAVYNSPWATYYNPALQGLDDSVRVGYSLGMRLSVPKFSINDNTNSTTNPSASAEVVFGATSENGLSFQIPIPMSEDTFSSLGFGLFYTNRGIFSLNANANTGGTNSNGKINTLSLFELPITYSLGVSGSMGSFYVGTALKYIRAQHGLLSTDVQNAIDEIFSDDFFVPRGVVTSVFGVDAGIVYSFPYDALTIGVVGKYLNKPRINLMDGSIFTLDPQYRLGLSINAIPLTTIAFDIDLTPNIEFGFDNQHSTKVQYAALGGRLNAGLFDLRLGVSKNILENDNDFLFSGGIGFTFLDVSVYSNTKIVDINGLKIPSNIGIRVGGSLAF